MVLRYFISNYWKYYRIIRHLSLTFSIYFVQTCSPSIICMPSGNCINVACMSFRILKTSQTKFLCNVCTTHSKPRGCHYKDFALIFIFLNCFFLCQLPQTNTKPQTNKQTKFKHHHHNKKTFEMNCTRPFTNV